MVEVLLFVIASLLLWLCIMFHTHVQNLFYLINLIEYGDKKNGRAPILPEAQAAGSPASEKGDQVNG